MERKQSVNKKTAYMQPVTEHRMMHKVMTKYYTSGSFNIEDRALSDFELNYIRDWQRNEILFEYFNTLKEGFTCTLI